MKSQMSDDAIIAMAGLGAFMAGYAGVSITAQSLQAAVSVADKAGKSALSFFNRNPIERTLDRLGIGMIPNPQPVKGMPNNNWWLERKTGLGTQDIGALGLGLVAAAAIMWEMKHPYVGKAVNQGMEILSQAQDHQRKMIKELMPLLKDMTPTAQVEAVGKVIPSLTTLIPLLA